MEVRVTGESVVEVPRFAEQAFQEVFRKYSGLTEQVRPAVQKKTPTGEEPQKGGVGRMGISVMGIRWFV